MAESKFAHFKIALARRGGEFVAQSEVERQLPRDLPVVLDKHEIHVLVYVERRIGILLVPRRETEQQVGQRILPAPVHAGEAAGEIEVAEQRADVANSGFDIQQLAAELQRMRAVVPGERLADVQASRCLELGYRRGPPDPLQRSAGKVEDRKAAANRGVGRRVLQPNQFLRAAGAEIGRQLKEVAHRVTEARFGDHRRANTHTRPAAIAATSGPRCRTCR